MPGELFSPSYSSLSPSSSESDISDLGSGSVRPLLTFPRHVWNQAKPSSYSFTLCNNCDSREFIKVKANHESGSFVYSGGFYYDIGLKDKVFLRFNKTNLLFSSDNSFIAVYEQDWRINCESSFDQSKADFLKHVKITSTLRDNFEKTWKDRFQNLAKFLEDNYGEDIFQVGSLIVRITEQDNLTICTFLENIANNSYISEQFKVVCSEFCSIEHVMKERNKGPLKFTSVSRDSLFIEQVAKICNNAKIAYIKQLENICHFKIFPFVCKLSAGSGFGIFRVSKDDINLFSDLIRKNDGKGAEIQSGMLSRWQDNFITRVNSCRDDSITKSCPLTNPIFYFLLKNFSEILSEIGGKVEKSVIELFRRFPQEWNLVEEIEWPTSSNYHFFLESQARFLAKLLKHYEPGNYRAGVNYPYQFPRSSKQCLIEASNAIQDASKVWLFLLNTGIISVVEYENNARFPSSAHISLFDKLVLELAEGFSQFLKTCPTGSAESFRQGVFTMGKFISMMRELIATLPKNHMDFCQDILGYQIDSISSWFSINSSQSGCNFDDLQRLVDEFSTFWQRLPLVLEFGTKFPHGQFLQALREISTCILTFIKHVQIWGQGFCNEMLSFFKRLNEFLLDLENLDFTWIVKERIEDLCINIEETNSYEVLEDKIDEYMRLIEERPNHFLIEVIQDFVKTLNNLVAKLNPLNWTNGEKILATSAFISSLTQSFIFLKDQGKYESFTNFLSESTVPFSNFTSNAGDIGFDDFMRRVDRLTESFWYTKKQNEIDIVQALKLYKEINEEDGELNDSLLTELYNGYLIHLNSFLGRAGPVENWEELISQIVSELSRLKTINRQNKFESDPTLKVLAGLGAVWALQISKDQYFADNSSTNFLKPHCIQILAIIRLLGLDNRGKMENHLAEVLTGQGKSLVLALHASLLALSGYPVRVLCYSKYLADRDKGDFLQFFKIFKLESKISYDTFKEMAEEIMTPKIGGREWSLRELVKERVLTGTTTGLSTNVAENPVGNTILLIDEVDVFFSPEFYGNATGAMVRVPMDALIRIQPWIWEGAKNNGSATGIRSHVQSLIEENIKKREKEFTDLSNFLAREDSYNLLPLWASCAESYTNSKLWDEHLSLMISIAVQVAQNDPAAENHRYSIKDGKVLYRDSNDKDVDYIVHKYFNTFNYFALKESDFEVMSYHNFGYLNIYCGAVSYAYLPRGYKHILGVTGTLSGLAQHEQIVVRDSFKILKNSLMPSFFGRSNRLFCKESDVTVLTTQEEWGKEIYDRIQSKIATGRAVLVFFETREKMESFAKDHSGKLSQVNILTENTDLDERRRFLEEAGDKGRITLGTRVQGRGIDFKSSSTVEKVGGVHVIQTFFSIDVKEETQIKGRTARKDNKGSYELVLWKKDLIDAKLIKDDNCVISYDILDTARMAEMEKAGAQLAANLERSRERHLATMRILYGEDYVEEN